MGSNLSRGFASSLPSSPAERKVLFLRAAQDGDFLVLLELVNYHHGRKEFLDHQDTEGNTAVHYVCQQGDHDSLRLLLEGGASPHVYNNNGYAAIHYCVDEDDETGTHLFLENDFEGTIKCTTERGEGLLHFCVKNDKMNCFQLLLLTLESVLVECNALADIASPPASSLPHEGSHTSPRAIDSSSEVQTVSSNASSCPVQLEASSSTQNNPIGSHGREQVHVQLASGNMSSTQPPSIPAALGEEFPIDSSEYPFLTQLRVFEHEKLTQAVPRGVRIVLDVLNQVDESGLTLVQLACHLHKPEYLSILLLGLKETDAMALVDNPLFQDHKKRIMREKFVSEDGERERGSAPSKLVLGNGSHDRVGYGVHELELRVVSGGEEQEEGRESRNIGTGDCTRVFPYVDSRTTPLLFKRVHGFPRLFIQFDGAIADSGWTSMHISVRSGSLACVQLLYMAKECSTAPTCFGQTPLHIACCAPVPNLAPLLLSYSNRSLSARDVLGNTPLHYLAHYARYCAQNDEVEDILSTFTLLLSHSHSCKILLLSLLNHENATPLDVLQGTKRLHLPKNEPLESSSATWYNMRLLGGAVQRPLMELSPKLSNTRQPFDSDPSVVPSSEHSSSQPPPSSSAKCASPEGSSSEIPSESDNVNLNDFAIPVAAIDMNAPASIYISSQSTSTSDSSVYQGVAFPEEIEELSGSNGDKEAENVYRGNVRLEVIEKFLDTITGQDGEGKKVEERFPAGGNILQQRLCDDRDLKCSENQHESKHELYFQVCSGLYLDSLDTSHLSAKQTKQLFRILCSPLPGSRCLVLLGNIAMLSGKMLNEFLEYVTSSFEHVIFIMGEEELRKIDYQMAVKVGEDLEGIHKNLTVVAKPTSIKARVKDARIVFEKPVSHRKGKTEDSETGDLDEDCCSDMKGKSAASHSAVEGERVWNMVFLAGWPMIPPNLCLDSPYLSDFDFFCADKNSVAHVVTAADINAMQEEENKFLVHFLAEEMNVDTEVERSRRRRENSIIFAYRLPSTFHLSHAVDRQKIYQELKRSCSSLKAAVFKLHKSLPYPIVSSHDNLNSIVSSGRFAVAVFGNALRVTDYIISTETDEECDEEGRLRICSCPHNARGSPSLPFCSTLRLAL